MEPVILTQRLSLSRLISSDAPAVYGYRSDPEVCRFQSFEPGSLADVEAFIAGLLPNAFATPGAWFQFAIRSKETGSLLGDLGTHVPVGDPRQAEIGFTLAPAYQHQGYATEAVAALLDHLLGPMRMHRVFASVDPRNAPSIALLERLGLRKEAHFRQSLWFKGEWADDVIYAVLASEWSGR